MKRSALNVSSEMESKSKRPSSQLEPKHSQIAILDFGSQYSHLIARRVRELNVFCELYSCLVEASLLEGVEIHGIILSGGPCSVYDAESPHVDQKVWDLIEKKNIPILGVCYGMQEITLKFGGTVSPSNEREYGRAMVRSTVNDSALMQNVFESGDTQMWMSHGDKVTVLPEGFRGIAATDTCAFAGFENTTQKMFGIQFHPEVTHSPKGIDLLRNFVVNVCGAPTTWSMANLADTFIRQVRERVGPEGHVIGAVSGGVDSSVAACLMKSAIGDRFHAFLVDNGCLRKGESAEVIERLSGLGINIQLLDASKRFLDNLAGVSDPEAKRKIIGNTFIDCFEEEAQKIEKATFLLQGTLYPDVIESLSYKGPSATIKSHHNVGGLPDRMKLNLIEPLRELFKDEVRELGVVLGIPANSVWRHPFPGPGLAIRVLGEIKEERVAMAREADAILIEELKASGEYDKIAQALVVLLNCKSVGVMGDGRTYESACVIRCVQTSDFMTADWYPMPYDLLGKISSRIINEVKGINRVTYDVSSKPPATIEWE